VCTGDDFTARRGDREARDAAAGAPPLHALLDDLLAMQRDLAGDVMPRAARITGTSQLLHDVRVRLDAAIGTARALLADERRDAVDGSQERRPGAWSAEQKGLAAVQAARSVT
jgi:hypothetical protein